MEVKNNSADLYEQYQNGIPVSELSRITGTKPKTIYKRFERMRNAAEIIDNVDKIVDNVDESVYIVENNVDNVEEMIDNVDKPVDNVEIAATDGTALSSFGKNALIALVLVCIGLLLYMTYKRWRQYKAESVLSN